MVARIRDDERGRGKAESGRFGDSGKRKDMAFELQRELEREFMLEQLEELSTDFSDNPEQIGIYLADLEVAGLLTPADKGMIFRRLWETMGPAFADRAFGMTERAVDNGELLAAEIASDAFAEVDGGRATFTDKDEYQRVVVASSALEALARVLGLKIEVPRPELKRRPEHIHDADIERATKTHELLGALGSQLGVDASRVDVRVDDQARERTAGQGIWGLMTDGTVFLDPDLYDPETSEGRHLLAHEVVHVAQLENRLRGANDAPDLFQAEAEADELSAMFAETGDIGMAPLASLARYDQAACGPREMATPKEPEPTPREPRKEVVVVPDLYKIVEDQIAVEPILFKVDKDQISETEEGAVPILQKAAKTIKSYPQITKLHIEGHTSTTATWDHNMKLSKGRAKSVKDWLADTGGVTISMSSEGYGEAVARKEQNIKDDRSSAEVKSQRKVIYRIIEVDGKAVPPGWKPTRQVIDVPGKTITRIFDADGKLISEEVVVNGAAGPENQSPGTAQGAAGTNPNQAAPAGQQNTSTGGTAPTQVQQTEVQPIIPGGPTQTETPAPTPPQPTGGGSDQVVFKQKVKPPKRDKKSRTPRRYAQGSIIAAQAKAGPGGLTTTDIANTSRSVGGGEPIPDGLRGRFETAFGANFSDVRIHRGSTQATGIGATAFARGTDIHFAPGRFDEGSSSGLAVLGHELTHIVQQRAGRVAVPQGKGTHVNVERVLEAEADLLGSRAARGESVHVQGSSAGLYARAARGEADTIQYEDGAGAEGGEAARPTEAEVRLGGQRIRARMPAGSASPGRISVDFSGAASVAGLSLKQASLVFNDKWEVTEGHIMASIAIGSYVNCEDIRLSVTEKSDSGGKYGELAAEVNDAQFKIDGLLDGKVNLRLATSGISGNAHIDFSQLTIGQNITLTGGSLDFALTEAGEASVSSTVTGTVTMGGVSLNVELSGQAMTDGHLSAAAKVSLAAPVAVPGVEGVTIKSGEINGSYVHNQEWTVSGNLVVNVRDWVEADISASYKQPAGDAASEMEFNGTLRQLQPYTLGDGENQLTFSNGEIDFHFKNGEFLQVDARTDYTSTNWQGRLTGTFNVPESKLSGEGTINLVPEQLPIGGDGIRLTRAAAVLTLTDNELVQITGGATVVFPYEEQDTFQLDGNDFIYNVKDSKVTGTGSVTTMRDLNFGDSAGYNAVMKSGAVGTLSVADNKLLGISGGLAFNISHAAEQIGNGTLDINFDGPSQQLNATATFTLTAEGGFGVPDRTTGPVMLLPGGQFQLTITNNALASADVRNVAFEVKQAGEGASGKIAGTVNGNYDFTTDMLTATGSAHLDGDWPLAPADGVTLVLNEGGQIDVAVTNNTLTRVHGNFPYTCNIAAVGQVPAITIKGDLSGDYSDETKKFSGALTGQLMNDVVIPVNGDSITVKTGATVLAAVAESVPASFSVTFDCEYTRAGTLFCAGHVETAVYDFRTGDFDFDASLTLKTKIEKQTDDGKWKFVVNEESQVGVKVQKSELKLITGSIDFEIHDGEGALFAGKLTDAQLDVQDLKFTGNLDVALARDLAYPRSASGESTPEGTPPVQAVAKKDVSHITGSIANNVLTEVGAVLSFGVNLGGEEYGAGELTGNINMTTFEFGGTGKINLTKDLLLGSEGAAGEDPIAGWCLCFTAGSGLDVTIAANQLDKANINLGVKLLQNMEEVATGNVTGAYKLGDTAGFTGNVTADLTRRVPLVEGGGRFDFHLDVGTGFAADFTGGKFSTATLTAKIAVTENAKDKVIVSVGGTYTLGQGISGAGTINVVDEIMIKDGEWKLFLDAGSGGDATVTASKLEEIGGTIKLRLDKGDDPFASGDFGASYKVSEGTGAQTTAEGRVTLLSKVDITPPGAGEFQVFLAGGSVGAKITGGELDWVDGKITGEVNHGGALFANIDLQAKYQALGTPDFTGSGKIETVAPLQIVSFGGYDLWLGTGASITGSVKAFALDELTTNIPLELKKDGPTVVKASLTGLYKHAEKKFSGEGSAEVISQITIAEDVGGYSFYLAPASAIKATVTDNALDQVTGALVVLIADGTGPFLKASGQATYHGGEAPTVDAKGGLEVTRDKEMLTSASGFVVWLKIGTGATVDVAANQLNSIGGTIKIEVQKDGAAFARVDLGGTYTPTGGFGGSGEAELCKEYQVAETSMGGESYTVWVMPGTGAKIDIAASDIKHVGGTVIGMIKDGTGDFIRAEVTADYDFPGKKFGGKGSITVLKPKKLSEFDGNELWLAEGSGASGSVVDNNLQRVDGSINLQLKDAVAGHWLTCALKGGFDAAGGTGFSGGGDVTIHKDKKLADLGGYKFFLAEGGGANATIAQNKLTKVGGSVPFKVFDTKAEPLLRGKAEGTYLASTGKFSGSGEVFLGRNVEFPIGAGKLVFKEGSGGGGTVTDNELRKLTGVLKVDIHDSKGAMVGCEADGVYNAVTNKIERLSGTAKLLRPIDVGGEGEAAFLRIEALTGSATVENNELKELSGSLDFVLPRLNNMKGHFEGGWQKGAAADVFWGSGKIQFTLFDDPATGRKLSGEVDGNYQKNGNFDIHGEVDYQLNEMIGGKLGVTVDQTLDPILSGTLVVSDVILVQGRDLFKWGKDFSLLRTTVAAGPVPIAMEGGVKIGLGLSMLPLTLGASIGVTNFKPLSKDIKVPDFEAEAHLNTGVKLSASLKPWFSIGVGVAGIASAGLALQGEASLGVDVNVTPVAKLKGVGGVYSGSLGIGLSIVGSGALAITPQVYAELLGNRWPYDLAELRHELGPLFSYDYNFSFPFGDVPAAPEAGGGGAAPTTSAAAETRKIEGHKTPPPADPAASGAANRPAAVKGGADLNAANTDGKEGAKREGPMGELMQKIDSIQEWGAKIGAIAKVGGDLVSMLMFMITIPFPFGVAVAGAYLAYKLISGSLTIEEIVLAATTVWDLITSIDVSAIASLLPDWLVGMWNQIKGKSLDDLLIGMIDTMVEWLSNEFPSAAPVISVLGGVAKTVIQIIARIISAILSGNFGIGLFLDICRTIGGSVLAAVVEMAARAAAAAVADAAGAVVDFVASLW